MKIFDMHTHVGSWSPEGSYFSCDDLLEVLESNNVEFFCVSNLDCIDIDISKPGRKPFLPEKEGNMVLLKMFENNPKAKLLLVCDPKYGNPSIIKEFLDNCPGSFSGLKFHPEWHTLPCNSESYNPYMAIAKEYNLPVLVHSGHVDSPYSSPFLIYELAKRYPFVPVILGHLSTGGISSKKEAVKILKKSIENKDATLYADISWCDNESIVSLLNKLEGSVDRIMFGSDAPLGNYISPSEYAKFVNGIKETIEEKFPNNSAALLEKIFYINAKTLFKV